MQRVAAFRDPGIGVGLDAAAGEHRFGRFRPGQIGVEAAVVAAAIDPYVARAQSVAQRCDNGGLVGSTGRLPSVRNGRPPIAGSRTASARSPGVSASRSDSGRADFHGSLSRPRADCATRSRIRVGRNLLPILASSFPCVGSTVRLWSVHQKSKGSFLTGISSRLRPSAKVALVVIAAGFAAAAGWPTGTPEAASADAYPEFLHLATRSQQVLVDSAMADAATASFCSAVWCFGDTDCGPKCGCLILPFWENGVCIPGW